MALQRQPVAIIAASLDTGVDPKTAPIGKWARIENAHRGRDGEYTKKLGATFFSTTSFPSAVAVTDVWQLATYRGELVRLSKQSAYPLFVYSPTKGQWAHSLPPDTTPNDATHLLSEQRGPVTTRRYPVTASATAAWSSGIIATTGWAPDVALSGNYACVVYRDASNYLTRIKIMDIASGSVVMTANAGGVETVGHVEVVDGYFLVVTRTVTGDIKVDRIQISALGSGTGLPTTFTHVLVAATAPFQTLAGASLLTIAAHVSGAGGTAVVEFNPSAGTFAATTHAALDSTMSVGWISDFGGGGKRYLACAGATNGVTAHVIESNRTVSASYSLEPTATTNVRNLVGHTINSTASGHFNLLFDTVNTTTKHLSRTRFVQRTGAGIQAGEWLRSICIRSKTFKQGSDYWFVGAFDSTLQPTYFLFRVPTDTVSTGPSGRGISAIVMPWQGNGMTEDVASPTNFQQLVSGRWLCALTRKVRLQTTSGGFYFDLGVDLVEFGFDQVMGRPVEAAEVLNVPGGTTPLFDGQAFAEAGFPVYPEQPTALTPGAVGGMTAGGVYSYVVVYRYTDGAGRVHRSAPSVPKSVTLGGGDGHVDVSVVNLRIGGRVNNFDCGWELYRTENAGSLYYLLASGAQLPTADTSAYADTVADTALTLGELLYTTGGVLEHHPVPASIAVVEYRQRLWCIPSEQRDVARHTKQFAPGLGAAWNNQFEVSFADEHGDLTALAVMDDKLIFFKANAIYALVGDGPDNLGRGGYSLPQRIAVGEGTIYPASVVVTPQGIMFQHEEKGIRLLTRGMGVEPVGEPVDQYNTTPIVGAVHLPGDNHVRFFAGSEGASGITRVFDYRHKEWTTHNSQTAISAVVYNDLPVWAFGNAVYTETPNGYIWHDGSDITATYYTHSIALAGIAGFQRVYELQLTGEYVGPHRLIVELSYDDNTASVDQFVLEMASDTPWKLAIKPERQRCTSMRINIYDDYSDDFALLNSAGFKLSAITLLVGVIPGSLNKLAAARRLIAQ